MTWKRERPEDLTETVFRSEARVYAAITGDINTVIERLVALTEEHPKTYRSPNNKVLCTVNTTVGNVMITWYDPESSDSVMDGWVLYLDLMPFWNIAETHEEGLYHFTKQVHFALCNLFEDYYVVEYGEDGQADEATKEYLIYELWALYEGSAGPEQIIV